ncbi:MAG TPA: hypothetical protein VGN98_02195, partial [Tianweitania sediminis]|nr:hypothetical protein [Tianweitania sediminis]
MFAPLSFNDPLGLTDYCWQVTGAGGGRTIETGPLPMFMNRRAISIRNRWSRVGLALALAAGVASCSSVSRETTGSVDRNAKPIAQMSSSELERVALKLGQAYSKKPSDKATA